MTNAMEKNQGKKNRNHGWGFAMLNRVKEGLAKKVTSKQKEVREQASQEEHSR